MLFDDQMKNTKLAVIVSASLAVIMIFSIVLVDSASFVAAQRSGISSQPAEVTQSNSAGTAYGDNGVTCTLPSNAPPYIVFLVPQVTQSSGFLKLANGNPYIYEYNDNITDRTVVIGGVVEGNTIVGGATEHLPPVVEMVFYTYGSSTICGETSSATAIHAIVVQVPVQNGAFNMTGATFHLSYAREG